jgi:hypothetical protein
VDGPASDKSAMVSLILPECLASKGITFDHGDVSKTSLRDSKRKTSGTSK